MSTNILLIGPLANRQLADLLGPGGTETTLRGRLSGGANGGVMPDGWPVLHAATDPLPAIEMARSDRLDRYLAVMQAAPLQTAGGPAYGARSAADPESPEEPFHNNQPDLIVALAEAIIAAPPDLPAAQLALRLPMLAVWVQSQLRAVASPPSGGRIIAARAQPDVIWHDQKQEHAGFFGLDTVTLEHRRHDGSFTPQISREAFIMGDAVVVLPWDPVRDRVLVIEQFRIAPAVRRDPQPWLLEAIAGRIDPGETPEQAARREATEEAELALSDLIPAPHYYPSPGAVTEFLYNYVGIADLPDDTAGIFGLDDENEDIRGHLLGRAELMRMVFDGQITNGPLMMIALWLTAQATALRDQHATDPDH